MEEDINVDETTQNPVQSFTYLVGIIARDSHILTPVTWNNLPASVVVLDNASTFKNWTDHPMRHDFLAIRRDAFSE